ncbi:outer envelope protein 64, mitochondrial isoform X3 [Pistacia vera]|uniref:outer envelope protein 64, mitochondrial isoform X3 n=1 Tax=Pistacia vera TaxID=55513 RepID=UPI001263CA46|nr:outer envelope protein 64, mitochondrial isoform X3 [Pistacia vera]
MSKSLNLIKTNALNPKVWVVIGVSVVGIVVVAETLGRRRKVKADGRVDFCAFIERFELLPFPQPPPPAARQPLSGLKFAIKDIFDVKGYITGFGSPDWGRTHGESEKTAVVVTLLLKNGATCVGKTVMDELAFGITGENKHYGTPINPKMPSHIPGGSSSGSAVSVAAELVDFALASFCGILGYRPSHGAVSMIGVLPNSQTLDTVGWFARTPSILHRVGHVLLQLNAVEPRRASRLIFADDVFQLSKVPKLKTLHVISKAIERLSGYKPPNHLNFGQYIASRVPSLKGFHEKSTNLENRTSILKALSSVMISLQRYEFKTNHEEWIKSVKPRFGPGVSDRVLQAISITNDNMKLLYKVRTEMRAALRSLLKDDGILVIPAVADHPLKLNTKKGYSTEFHSRACVLSSIASMSGCCQVAIPLGKHDQHPISISFISYHGADKFLLDTVLDMYDSLQEQANIASNSVPLPDTNVVFMGTFTNAYHLSCWTLDQAIAKVLLIRHQLKGNAAFKGRQWNKAVSYYSEAIKINGTNATYYCNRAAAYLELGCFQQAEEDCSKAISLDKKNVKAYLRRGTAKETLLCYKEASQDFKHALVLEPQNKVANLAEKRLRKLVS